MYGNIKKTSNKYSLRLKFTEYYDEDGITSIDLLDYFEIMEPERILNVIEYFTEKLKRYLEKNNIIKKEI